MKSGTPYFLKTTSGMSGFMNTLWLVKKSTIWEKLKAFPFLSCILPQEEDKHEERSGLGQYSKQGYKTLHVTMEEVKTSCDPIINFLCNWEQIFMHLVIENTCFSREKLRPYDQRKPLKSIYYYFYLSEPGSLLCYR